MLFLQKGDSVSKSNPPRSRNVSSQNFSFNLSPVVLCVRGHWEDAQPLSRGQFCFTLPGLPVAAGTDVGTSV